MLDFNHYSTKSNYYDHSNKLVIGKTKDKNSVVAIRKFVRLSPKVHSFLKDSNIKYKKVKNSE